MSFKLPGRELLPATFTVPFRVPFGLRIFFRGAFALLALATLALALNVLQEEKQRSHRVYAEGLRKNQAQIAARLRHPTGQLALLNPQALDLPATPVRPLLLPFSAIDFDDRFKAQQAVEMAGCALQYPDTATLCAGIGANPYAGGFIYVVASLRAPSLVAHQPGDLELGNAHRALVSVSLRGQSTRWIAPYEISADGRGRLVGLADELPIKPGSKPVRDFRGWLWQETRCAEAGSDATDCPRRSFLSLRLPIEAFREALAARQPVWPPPDLAQIEVHLKLLPPGDGPPLFDSDAPGAVPPLDLAELRALLLPGERLRVRRAGAATDLLDLRGGNALQEQTSPWLDALIRRLPVEGFDAPLEARETLATPLGRYELVLSGDIRSVNQGLAAVATRLSWFVAAMLGAVLFTWLAIEVRIIRRVTLLTKRAAAVSTGVRSADGASAGLAELDLSDLRSRDELGVLSQGLQDLLQRVNEDMRREHIRAGQEKDLWHAVGHEIMSPLQSLMALHGRPGDASERYITRMQQAVRVLYGQASPSEAFEATTLALQPVDLDAFLGHVAGNAGYIGIADVLYASPGKPVLVRADEYPLEDVVSHVLRNADRHRKAGTAIRITLEADATVARVQLHNQGAPIVPEMLERIFEYGVSEAAEAPDGERRGQGLFVARTYMAKMGGTIAARNVDDGVVFTLTLQRAPA